MPARRDNGVSPGPTKHCEIGASYWGKNTGLELLNIWDLMSVRYLFDDMFCILSSLILDEFKKSILNCGIATNWTGHTAQSPSLCSDFSVGNGHGDVFFKLRVPLSILEQAFLGAKGFEAWWEYDVFRGQVIAPSSWHEVFVLNLLQHTGSPNHHASLRGSTALKNWCTSYWEREKDTKRQRHDPFTSLVETWRWMI